MNFFIILLIIVTAFLLIIKLIASLTGRVSERMLTNYFRDLEALLTHDKLPDGWVEELKKMAHKGHSHHTPWEEPAKDFLLKNIHRLHKYFEECPFVEGPEARALLLEQLEALTRHWETAELSEILAYYGLSLSDGLGPQA